MNTHAIIQVLEYVNHFHLFISLDRVKKNILYSAKLHRKGLTKEEIEKKGLNIYSKTGIPIDSLLEYVIQNGYVEVHYEKEMEVRITPNGLKRLMELYTDNHCDSYSAYYKKVNALTEKRNETDFDPLHIAGMYYYKRSLSEIEETYFQEKAVQEEVQAYHDYLFSLYGIKSNQESLFLHLTPKIFLLTEDMWEDIELKMKGIELPAPLILGRPYPNQRYVVAGTKVGKEKLYTGMYPLIASKSDFPKELDIQYHWKLGNGKKLFMIFIWNFK